MTNDQQKQVNPAPREVNSKNTYSEEELSRLAEITEQLTRTMEKTRIAEYVNYLDHPFRLLWNNFLIGLARGLGSTVGLAIVLAALAFLVQKLVLLNLPVISDFIADFLKTILDNISAAKP